jgi:hypothetical protein
MNSITDNNNIDKENEEILENLEITYNMWKKCFDNHLIIEDEKNKNITFDNLNKRHSIIFSNCNNINITIKNKINHVIIQNCKNIIIILNNILISGLDIIHSDEIKLKIDENINNLNYSFSNNLINIINQTCLEHLNMLSACSSNIFYYILRNNNLSPAKEASISIFHNYTFMNISEENNDFIINYLYI